MREKVDAIFEGALNTYNEHKVSSRTEVWIEVDSDAVTFDKLAALSDLFQTRKINLGTETREGGYCETCAYSYSVVVIRVEDIKVPL